MRVGSRRQRVNIPQIVLLQGKKCRVAAARRRERKHCYLLLVFSAFYSGDRRRYVDWTMPSTTSTSSDITERELVPTENFAVGFYILLIGNFPIKQDGELNWIAEREHFTKF